VLFNEIVYHFQATQAPKISSNKGVGELLPSKLKDMTMTDDEKEMLIAMKDYILKVSKSSARNATRRDADLPWIIAAYATSQFVPLKNFAIELNTSFLVVPIIPLSPTMRRGVSAINTRPINSNIPGSNYSSLSAPGRGVDQSYMQVSSQEGMSRSPLSLLTQNLDKRGIAHVASPESTNSSFPVQDSDTISISASELSERGVRRGSFSRIPIKAGEGSYIAKLLEKKTNELSPAPVDLLGSKIGFSMHSSALSTSSNGGSKRRLKSTSLNSSAGSTDIKSWRPAGMCFAGNNW
jgi:hypothetical protein